MKWVKSDRISISITIFFSLHWTFLKLKKRIFSLVGEYGDHFEGDLILNQKQLNASKSEESGLDSLDIRWPENVIPYQLSGKHTKQQQNQIEMALSSIEAVSCLKFKRRSNESDFVKLSVSGLKLKFVIGSPKLIHISIFV